MKKFGAVAVLLSVAIVIPAVSFGQTPADQAAALRAQIQALMAQIQQMQSQLAQLEGGTLGFCYNWKTNLRIGDRGEDVKYLNQALEREGFRSTAEEPLSYTVFTEETAAAVVGFQEKYRPEILAANGLQRGTGYVGPSTRAVLNRLYRCSRPVTPEPIPVTPIYTEPLPVTPVPIEIPQLIRMQDVPPPIPVLGPAYDVKVEVKTTDSNADHAGVGYVFGSGPGGTNKNPADWNWVLTLSIPSGSKTISGINLFHNTPNELWSTYYGDLYPIVALANGVQLNTASGQPLGPYAAGTHTLELYGQRESEPFRGGSLIIYFTDGTYTKTSVPAGSGVARVGAVEQITCVFNGSNTTQSCRSTDGNAFGCTGTGSCDASVSGPVNSTITWKSTCGGYAYTTLDGFNEKAVFNCSGANSGAPVIGGLSAPTSLRVGEQGTWTIKASDPENGSLNYSVRWGDEGYTLGVTPQAISESATFTHVYSAGGVYTPTFTVSDNTGLSAQTSASVRVGDTNQTSITVLSPNGGEIWSPGSTQKVTWWSSGITKEAIGTIRLRGEEDRREYPLYAATGESLQQTLNDGSELVVTPSNLPNQGYRVEVKMPYPGGSAIDSSDSYFKIYSQTGTNRAPEIVSASAVAGTIQPGQVVSFGWNAKDADNDDLSWSVDWGDSGSGGGSSMCGQFGKGWSFNTSHAWTNPGTYKVVATVSDCARATATSVQYVTVGNPTQSSITVLSPNGGEIWKEGEAYTINWKSYGLPANAIIGITLFRSDEQNKNIVTNLPSNTTSYSWKVDTVGGWGYGTQSLPERFARLLGVKTVQAADGQYTVMVSAYWANVTGGSAYDRSDGAFTITSGTTQPSTPSVTVTSPNGGENFELGTSIPVTWTQSFGPASTRIDVISSNSGIPYSSPSINSAQGDNRWVMPSNAISAAGSYRVNVCSQLGTTNYCDPSNAYFSVNGPATSTTAATPAETAAMLDSIQVLIDALRGAVGQ